MIGIDPGYAIVGYGVIDYIGNQFRVIDYGAITTEAGLDFPTRLGLINIELRNLIKTHQPKAMAIEKIFFNKNVKTAIDVAQARGVMLLGAVDHNLSIGEYTPLQIKQAVVGYGGATKNQVQQMTKVLLGLDSIPKPDDTADALAVAICHAHSAGSYLRNIDL